MGDKAIRVGCGIRTDAPIDSAASRKARVVSEIGQDIGRAAALLRDGGLVAIPTETVYGLAANALDARAVATVFEAKNRPSFDPIIVHTHAVGEFDRYALHVSDRILRLAERLCPGPITFILPRRPIIPDIVTSGHPTVGLRIPKHELTLALLRSLEFPLAAPSANPFGYVSPTTAVHVADQLGDRVPYILDGGPCDIGLESTILDVTTERPRVLRLGGLSLETIEELLGEPIEVHTSSSSPHAPGMLVTHYAPGAPVEAGDLAALVEEHRGERVAVLAMSKIVRGIDPALQRVLAPSGDLREAAASLFRCLRELDALEIDLILAEWVPEEGLGRAINDRLRRASSRAHK